jgi:CRISPR/Cas system-associated exonuclease Cas4 (RecB family)
MSDIETTTNPDLMRHLSPTKIEGMMKCGLAVKFRYIDKIPEPAVGVMVAGSAVHAVLERALKQRILGAPLPSAADMVDWFGPAWDEQINERESKEGFSAWDWGDENADAVKEECKRLVEFTRLQVLDAIKPKVIEHECKTRFESAAGDFLVWGYIDLLEEDGLLSDWKTTKKVSANAQKLGMQLPYYSYEVIHLMGLKPDAAINARKIFLVRGKKPKVEVARYSVTQSQRKWFADVAAECWKATQSDAYVPNTSGWWCSAKFCSFYAMCQGELGEVNGGD